MNLVRFCPLGLSLLGVTFMCIPSCKSSHTYEVLAFSDDGKDQSVYLTAEEFKEHVLDEIPPPVSNDHNSKSVYTFSEFNETYRKIPRLYAYELTRSKDLAQQLDLSKKKIDLLERKNATDFSEWKTGLDGHICISMLHQPLLVEISSEILNDGRVEESISFKTTKQTLVFKKKLVGVLIVKEVSENSSYASYKPFKGVYEVKQAWTMVKPFVKVIEDSEQFSKAVEKIKQLQLLDTLGIPSELVIRRETPLDCMDTFVRQKYIQRN